MFEIKNDQLTVKHQGNRFQMDLSEFATAAQAHAWAVPVEYRESGFFVSVQQMGMPQEVPACDSAAAVFIGSIDIAASESQRRSVAEAVAHARIEEWRDTQEQQTIVFQHDDRVWDGGLATRIRLQPVVSLHELPPGFFWTDHANEDVQLTPAELAELHIAHEQALVLRGFEIHAAQRALKAQLLELDLQALRDFNPVLAVQALRTPAL